MQHEKLTISSTPVALTSGIWDDGLINKATITIETASIRYTLDGSPPSSTYGHLVSAGSVITLTDRNQLRSFKAVRATSTDATIQVSYTSVSNGW